MNIPTAETIFYKEQDKGDPLYEKDHIRLMKEFAKLHCIEQARVIDKKAEIEFSEEAWDLIDDKDFIIHAYDLNLIK